MTLIVAASGYVVLVKFADPFLAKGLKPFVNWTFILGTLAAAVWLVAALFKDTEALMEALGGNSAEEQRAER